MENDYNQTARKLMFAWLGFIIATFAVAAYFMVNFVIEAKQEANERHIARIDRNATEAGRTSADETVISSTDTASQIKVKTGMYIDRIPHLSFRDAVWRVDFYIWFRWQGDEIDPGDSFQVIDGSILSKSIETKYRDGDENYALYRVMAEKTKFFSTRRFPKDDHLLTLRIEDTENTYEQMIYLPDTEDSAISSRVTVPSYKIVGQDVVEKPHSYKTRRGDTRIKEGTQATYSQLIYGIAISHPGWALYFKMFLGIFSAVGIALLSFLIRPELSGPRYSVGIGAFFAAVASTYVISRQLPQTGSIGLTDFVTGTSLVTIFLVLVSSTLALRIASENVDPALQRRFDIASLIVFVLCYAGLSVTVAALASN